uniref:PGG domain-containing protein n=1 Tax=Brassica oleracea var. oleracea TaxID=109376 RepID=A0A0D3DXC6_BRAOL
AVRLLLECQLVERNKVNGDGLTFLDILRNLENSGDWDLDLEQVVLKTRCKEAASMPKTKSLSDLLKSPFTVWTYYSTGLKRLRSDSSEEVRGAFLIVFTLIITVTYQTGLQPPGGDHSSKDPTKQAFFVLLWLSNTLGFYCSLFYTFSFLPLRGLFTSWYISIGTLLGVSYALAVAANSPDPVMFLMLTFVIFLLHVIYLIFLAVVGWRKHVTVAIKLLLECQLVKPNEVNGDGLTFLDILRHQGQIRDLELEQAVLKTGCKETTSLPKLEKTTSDHYKTPITFWSYFSTGIKRLKSDTSEEGRAVFLIICTLIITSTYQTALHPPGGLRQSEDGGSAAVMKQTFFIVLWVSNTIGFCCALLYTFCLLPVSSLFTTWFFWIGASLGVSYALAMAVISPHPVLFICAAFALYLLFPLYLFMEIFIALRLSHLKATVSRMFVTLLKQRQSKA